MGRAFSDDLRTRIGAADERGEGSCRVLANRFAVSWEYVRKLRQQRRENNSPVRRPQSRYGVPSRLSESVKVYMLALVEAQADITIAELREKIEIGQGVSVSWSAVRRWVKKLELRLKKSRSTPANATRKPTGSSVNSSSSVSVRRRRNG
jgi:putative transposase